MKYFKLISVLVVVASVALSDGQWPSFKPMSKGLIKGRQEESSILNIVDNLVLRFTEYISNILNAWLNIINVAQVQIFEISNYVEIWIKDFLEGINGEDSNASSLEDTNDDNKTEDDIKEQPEKDGADKSRSQPLSSTVKARSSSSVIQLKKSQKPHIAKSNKSHGLKAGDKNHAKMPSPNLA